MDWFLPRIGGCCIHICIQSISFIALAVYALDAPTEVKYIFLSYPYITQVVLDSHCEILWAENLVSGLVRHPTADYRSAEKCSKAVNKLSTAAYFQSGSPMDQ